MSYPPQASRILDPEKLPDLQDISADDASIYLCQFLMDLLRLHGSINPHTGINIDPNKNPSNGSKDTPPDMKSIDEVINESPEESELIFGLITPAALEKPSSSGQISPFSIGAESGSLRSPDMPQRTVSPTPGKRRLSSLLLQEAAAVAALIGDLGQEKRTFKSLKTDSPCVFVETSTTPHILGGSESAVIDDENDSQNLPIKVTVQDQRVICRRFYSKKAPEISLWQYIQRLHKYCPMAPSVYIAAGVYIYHLCIVMRMIPLTNLSVHRLLLASLRIACKSLEDVLHPQKRYAAVGGVSPADLYRLEIALLFLLEFDVSITLSNLYQGLGVFAELAVQTKHILGPMDANMNNGEITDGGCDEMNSTVTDSG